MQHQLQEQVVVAVEDGQVVLYQLVDLVVVEMVDLKVVVPVVQ
tara:strand:- start:108 stop:236 length:129 start_codon:yes stop_codon:yes gene_type:complete